MKIVIIGSIILKAIFFICVTIAAIYFQKPSLLWWYILGCFMGYEYESTPDSK